MFKGPGVEGHIIVVVVCIDILYELTNDIEIVSEVVVVLFRLVGDEERLTVFPDGGLDGLADV